MFEWFEEIFFLLKVFCVLRDNFMECFYGVVNCKSCFLLVYLVIVRLVIYWIKFEFFLFWEGELECLYKKKLFIFVFIFVFLSCIIFLVEFVFLMRMVDLKR